MELKNIKLKKICQNRANKSYRISLRILALASQTTAAEKIQKVIVLINIKFKTLVFDVSIVRFHGNHLNAKLKSMSKRKVILLV